MHGFNPPNIYEFYKKLVISVQSMATLGKLKEVNGYVKKPKTRWRNRRRSGTYIGRLAGVTISTVDLSVVYTVNSLSTTRLKFWYECRYFCYGFRNINSAES